MRKTFERWLSDEETWIGIFENRDMSHNDLGRRIALSFDDSLWGLAIVGQSKCPDHKDIGLGWRYILIEKTRDIEEAIAVMTPKEEEPDETED